MEKHTIFNLEALVSVEITDKRDSDAFFVPRWSSSLYKELKFSQKVCVFFGWLETPLFDDGREYFANPFIGAISREKMIEMGYLIIDNIVFYKPYVELTFVTGKNYIKEFDTYELAKKYGNRIREEHILKPLYG